MPDFTITLQINQHVKGALKVFIVRNQD